MEPFIFFSFGLTKSGSTLAFQLAHVALEQAGHRQPRIDIPGLAVSRKINAIEHVTVPQARALSRRVARDGPLVVKTHTRLDPAVSHLVAQGARVHVVVRDLRDIALSMLDNGRRSRARGRPAFAEIETLDDTFTALDNQLNALAQWAALPGVRLLRYDTLAFETTSAAAEVLDHLGLQGDPAAIAGEVLANRFTQFNKGIPDRHKQEMSATEAARFTARYAPFYDLILNPAAASLPLQAGTALRAPVDNPCPAG